MRRVGGWWGQGWHRSFCFFFTLLTEQPLCYLSQSSAETLEDSGTGYEGGKGRAGVGSA